MLNELSSTPVPKPFTTSYGVRKSHNPTTLNRQGPDVGTQYRSVIFYHTPEQKKTAEKSKEKLNKEKFNGKIVTAIESASEFYPAEEYHQKYYEKKGMCGYK